MTQSINQEMSPTNAGSVVSSGGGGTSVLSAEPGMGQSMVVHPHR